MRPNVNTANRSPQAVAQCVRPGIAIRPPEQPARHRPLSVGLRFLFATRPAVMVAVLGIVYRAIATHLGKKAGFARVR